MVAEYELMDSYDAKDYPQPKYCPYCQRDIVPEVVNGSGIYVHDDIEHPDYKTSEFEVKH